jgi:hypothetical protein
MQRLTWLALWVNTHMHAQSPSTQCQACLARWSTCMHTRARHHWTEQLRLQVALSHVPSSVHTTSPSPELAELCSSHTSQHEQVASTGQNSSGKLIYGYLPEAL